MITSIEIAKILVREKRNKSIKHKSQSSVYSTIGKKKMNGFDSGLMKLGGTLSFKKES